MPEQIKTRMAAPLSYIKAAILYISFLRESIESSARIKGIKRILCSYPPQSRSYFSSLIYKNRAMQVQQENSSGKKPSNAFQRNFLGSNSVLAIGTYSPSIDPDFTCAAFIALKRHKIVIGLSIYSIFYLLGLKVFCRRIFKNVCLNSQKTLSDTLRNIKNLIRSRKYMDYAKLLKNNFNPDTILRLMCLNQVTVDWKKNIYDCDFNLALNLFPSGFSSIEKTGTNPYIGQSIHLGRHCLTCTAGSGGSCHGGLK